ncbi:MAG TPA: hypothetical protein VGI92_08910 [Gemmatimonadales bacterium]
MVLHHVFSEITPTVPNVAIDQAQTYLRDRLADIEAVASELESGYWPKSPRRVLPD